MSHVQKSKNKKKVKERIVQKNDFCPIEMRQWFREWSKSIGSKGKKEETKGIHRGSRATKIESLRVLTQKWEILVPSDLLISQQGACPDFCYDFLTLWTNPQLWSVAERFPNSQSETPYFGTPGGKIEGKKKIISDSRNLEANNMRDEKLASSNDNQCHPSYTEMGGLWDP